MLDAGYRMLDARWWSLDEELIELMVNRSQVIELIDRAVGFSIRKSPSTQLNSTPAASVQSNRERNSKKANIEYRTMNVECRRNKLIRTE